MRVSNIEAHESKFESGMKDVGGQKYSIEDTVTVGNTTIKKIRPKHDTYFYKEETEKTAIVLHSTVGVLRGDLASLCKRNNKVSVPYLIARDGTVYELFDPKYWSYHLGRGAKGGNTNNSKRTIGIELSNMGPLTLVGNKLETAYSRLGKDEKPDVYCDISEVDAYVKVDKPFRGKQYFASFTDAQYSALYDLIDYLCEEHNIPRKYLPEASRFKTFKSSSDAKTFNGICSHVNFRTSGKWDIGPDFKWDAIIPQEMVFDEVVINPEPEEPVVDESNPVVEAPDKTEDLGDVIVDQLEERGGKWGSLISKIVGLFRR